MREKILKIFKIFLSLVLLISFLNHSGFDAVATNILEQEEQTLVLDDTNQQNEETKNTDIDKNTKRKENVVLTQSIEGVEIKLTAKAGVLKDSTVLNVKKVNSKAIESTIKKSLNKDMKLENVLAYDITLLVDGKEVQPDGDVKVEFSKLPFSKEKNKEVAVYHVLNKKVEDIDSKISHHGKRVDIETNHFSVYAISQLSQKTSLNVSLKFVNADNQTINTNVNGVYYAFITGVNNDRITKEIKVVDGQGSVTIDKIYDQNGGNPHDLSVGQYDVKLASRKNQDINETTRYEQNNIVTHDQGSKINGCFEINTDEKIIISGNQDNQLNIIARAKGNVIADYDFIKSSLETATRFGAFALDYMQSADVESTIAAKNAYITADYGFSSNNFDFINNKIVVNKIYKENGQPAKNKEIILRLYRKGTQNLIDEIRGQTDEQGLFNATFEKLTDGSYNLVEVINGQEVSKNMIVKDSDGKNVNVTLSKSEVIINSGYSNISYFDSINDGVINKCRRPGVIVVNKKADYDLYKDKMPSDLELVLAGEEGYKNVINFDDEFVALSNLSKRLSNIVSSQDVKVYYFDIDEFNNNNGGPRNYESDGKSYIVVNVDASKYKDSIGINGDFSIDGKHIAADFGKEDNAIDTKILFNFYIEENGVRTPYSGKIDQRSVYTGVILAPNSHYIGAIGNLGGTIIAKKYEHVSGEIHQEKMSKEVVKAITLTNEKNDNIEMLGSLKIVKVTNGATTPSDTEFKVTGPNGYEKTIKYSEFKNGEYQLDNLVLGEYKVVESGAEVKGYALTVSGDGSVIINENHLNQSLTLVNDYITTKLSINKVDEDGELLAGAELQILDLSGNIIRDFVTDGNEYQLDGVLEAGKTYVLHEVKAPDGYKVADDIFFTVNKDGSVNSIEMIDLKENSEVIERRTNLILYKVDQDENLLEGASFTLSKIDVNGSETIIETIDNGPRFEFKDLEDGHYIIYETVIPEGYDGIEPFEIDIINGQIYYDGEVETSFAIMNTDNGLTPGVLGDKYVNKDFEKDSFNYNVLGDKVVRDIKHVKTSDDQNILIYVGVGLVAGIVAFILMKKKKK